MVERRDLDGKPLEEVANFMARAGSDSHNDQTARAEFLLRQTRSMERQAAAAEQTASETAKYTRFMFWSVLVLAASSLVSLFVSFFRSL